MFFVIIHANKTGCTVPAAPLITVVITFIWLYTEMKDAIDCLLLRNNAQLENMADKCNKVMVGFGHLMGFGNSRHIITAKLGTYLNVGLLSVDSCTLVCFPLKLFCGFCRCCCSRSL